MGKRPDGKPACGNRDRPIRQGACTGHAPLWRGIRISRPPSLAVPPPSSFSNNYQVSISATLGARVSCAFGPSASNPVSFNQAPLIGHAAAEKTTPARCGLASTRIRDQPLQLRCC